jgi:hypothetical protein
MGLHSCSRHAVTTEPVNLVKLVAETMAVHACVCVNAVCADDCVPTHGAKFMWVGVGVGGGWGEGRWGGGGKISERHSG